MIAMKRKTNWQHLENIAHIAGPDAELHFKLHNVSPDADGTPDDTEVIIKCRVGFIKCEGALFVVPDFHSGGKSGRLEPNIWELVPTEKPNVFETRCLTENDTEGCKPDVDETLVKCLESAGYHWEEWAPRD
jgi:hypothetical protein